MILRTAQVEALQRAALARNLVQHLRETEPKAVDGLTDEEIRVRAAAALEKAATYGIHEDGDASAFAALTFTIAPRFDEHPALAKVLRDPSIPAEDRIDQLFERTTDNDWDEASLLR